MYWLFKTKHPPKVKYFVIAACLYVLAFQDQTPQSGIEEHLDVFVIIPMTLTILMC